MGVLSIKLKQLCKRNSPKFQKKELPTEKYFYTYCMMLVSIYLQYIILAVS